MCQPQAYDAQHWCHPSCNRCNVVSFRISCGGWFADGAVDDANYLNPVPQLSHWHLVPKHISPAAEAGRGQWGPGAFGGQYQARFRCTRLRIAIASHLASEVGPLDIIIMDSSKSFMATEWLGIIDSVAFLVLSFNLLILFLSHYCCTTTVLFVNK